MNVGMVETFLSDEELLATAACCEQKTELIALTNGVLPTKPEEGYVSR